MDAAADIVELDVRRTADGELVVVHDATISEVPVAELALSEIGRLQPGIPTLDETLELLRGRVALEVEIKNDPNEVGYEPTGSTIAREVAAALHRHAFSDAFVASFDQECLRSVQQFDDGIETGLLLHEHEDLDGGLENAAGRHGFLLPEARALERAGRAFIDRAHDSDVLVCTWTVDDASTLARLFRLGADAVETNDPSLGVTVRDSLTTPE